MSTRRALLFSLALTLTLSGCGLFLGSDSSRSLDQGQISLKASVALFPANPSLSGDLVAGGGVTRTLLPLINDLGITAYGFKATSASGVVIAPPDSPDGAFLLDRVPPGFWTIVLSGKNSAGVEVAGGTATVQVEAGKTVNVAVFLAPSGTATGTLQFDLSWDASVKLSSVTLALEPAALALSSFDTGAGQSKTISLQVPPGSYVATLEYFEGTARIKSQVRAAEIFSGKTSKNAMTFLAADFNSALTLGPWLQPSAPFSPWSQTGTTSLHANGYVYFAGGQNTNITIATMRYAKLNADGSFGALVTAPDLPYALSYPSLLHWNGRLYLIGGYRNNYGQTPAFNKKVFSAAIGSGGMPGIWRDEGVEASFAPTTYGTALIWAYENPSFPTKPYLVYVERGSARTWPINADGSLGTYIDLGFLGFTDSSFGDPNYLKVIAKESETEHGLYYLYAISRSYNYPYPLTIIYAKLASTGTVGLWSTAIIANSGDWYEIIPGSKFSYVVSNIAGANGQSLSRLDSGLNGLPSLFGVASENALQDGSGGIAYSYFQNAGFLYSMAGYSPTAARATVSQISDSDGSILMSQKAGELPFPSKFATSANNLDAAKVVEHGGFLYSLTNSKFAYAPLTGEGRAALWKLGPNPPGAGVLTALGTYLYLAGYGTTWRSALQIDGSPGAWTACTSYPSTFAGLGGSVQRVFSLGGKLYLFFGTQIAVSTPEVNGDLLTWATGTGPAINGYVPFAYAGDFYSLVLRNSFSNPKVAAALQKATLSSQGLPTAWTTIKDDIDFTTELYAGDISTLDLLGATSGPKGIYILGLYAAGYSSFNVVIGMRLDSGGNFKDSRIVAKNKVYRSGVSSTFVYQGYYYVAGGWGSSASGTYYVEKRDIQSALLDP